MVNVSGTNFHRSFVKNWAKIKNSITPKLAGHNFDPQAFDRRHNEDTISSLRSVTDEEVRRLLASKPGKSLPMDFVTNINHQIVQWGFLANYSASQFLFLRRSFSIVVQGRVNLAATEEARVWNWRTRRLSPRIRPRHNFERVGTPVSSESASARLCLKWLQPSAIGICSPSTKPQASTTLHYTTTVCCSYDY